MKEQSFHSKKLALLLSGFVFKLSYMSSGQNISDSLLYSSSNKVLALYFHDSLRISANKKFDKALVFINLNPEKLIENSIELQIKYVPKERALQAE